MGRDPKRKQKERFWGCGPHGIGRSPIMVDMTPEAMAVNANIRFSVNTTARTRGDEDVPWGYGDGPVKMSKCATARGLFTVIRLGLFEIVDGGAFRNGRYRKSRYRVSHNWTRYDPARPGRFILESPHCSPRWKACFDADGRWKSGVNPKKAPQRSRAGIFPVCTSDSEAGLSVCTSDADEDGESPVGLHVRLTRAPPKSARQTHLYISIPCARFRGR